MIALQMLAVELFGRHKVNLMALGPSQPAKWY